MSTLADTLRAAADRIEQLPQDLPPPAVEISGGHVHVRWSQATESTARKVLAALPGEWNAVDTYMYRYSGDDLIGMVFVYLARTTPLPVVNPAALIAEQVDQRDCTCGTDVSSLDPGEVVVHRYDGPCYIAKAAAGIGSA